MDLTQRGDRVWKEAQREGEDRVTLRKALIISTQSRSHSLFKWVGADTSLNTADTSLNTFQVKFLRIPAQSILSQFFD